MTEMKTTIAIEYNARPHCNISDHQSLKLQKELAIIKLV